MNDILNIVIGLGVVVVWIGVSYIFGRLTRHWKIWGTFLPVLAPTCVAGAIAWLWFIGFVIRGAVK